MLLICLSLMVPPAFAMQIFIRPTAGENFPVEVEPTDRIEDLRGKIEAAEGILSSMQQLTFEGKLLEDGNTLQDYSIQEDDVVDLTVVETQLTLGEIQLIAGNYYTVVDGQLQQWAQADPPADGYAHWDGAVLTLKNFQHSTEGYPMSGRANVGLWANGDLTLRLEGDNSLKLMQSGDKVGPYGGLVEGNLTVEQADGGEQGALTVTGLDDLVGFGSSGILIEGDLAVNNATLQGVGGEIEILQTLLTAVSCGVQVGGSITVSDTGTLDGRGGNGGAAGYSYGVLANQDITVSGDGVLLGTGGDGDRSYGVVTEHGSIQLDGGVLSGISGTGLSLGYGVYLREATQITGSDGSLLAQGSSMSVYPGNHVLPANYLILDAGSDAWEMAGSVTLPREQFILETGKTLEIPEGGVLTIPEGVELVNAGTLTNSGSLVNHGTIINTGRLDTTAGSVEENGRYEGAGVVDRAAQDAPEAPGIDTVTEDRVSLTPVSASSGGGAEYGYATGDDAEPGHWQVGTEFSGLTAGTAYTFYARYSGNTYYLPSETSDPVTVYTAAAAPGEDEGFQVDYGAETATAESGYEIGTDGNSWSAGPLAVTPGGVLYVRVAAVADGAAASEATEVTLPDRQDAPSIQMNLIKTGDTVTVAGQHDGYEFSVDGETWNRTGVFTGLDAGTVYTVQVRLPATANSFCSHSASQTVTTVNADGSTTVQPGETVETEAGVTITNDGGTTTITGGGSDTTVTGGEVSLGQEGEITVPSGAEVETDSGRHTVTEGGGIIRPDAGLCYTVEFQSQGGPDVDRQTVPVGSTVTQPDSPTQAGQVFGGWYREASCVTEWNFDTDVVDGNLTLYAKWTAQSGGGGGGVLPGGFPVAIEPSEHGVVTVSPSGPVAGGTTATIHADPAAGYEVNSVWVVDNQGNRVEIVSHPDGTYTFEMPGLPVRVYVTFVEVQQQSLPFADVADSGWIHDAVRYVWENNLMQGTGDTTFNPHGTMTRSQFVTILWRMEGSPNVGSSSFTDVVDGVWYDQAAAWGDANGIVNGYGDGLFGPNDPITREQMVSMMYRYAEYKGYDLTANGDLSVFTDADLVAGWAETSMRWAVGHGLIQGSDNQVNPKGNSERCQVAAVVMRFLENLAK